MTFASRGYVALALLAVALMLTGVSGCRRHPDAHPGPAVVARMDDSLLTLRDVEARLPAGLTPADSSALASAIIEGWIEDRLFSTYLSLEPAEEERIARMTEDYRRRLRMEAYRSRIRREHEPPVSADSIAAYYDEHRREMVAERPLVKGLYAKVPASSETLPEIRRLMQSASSKDVERLEMEMAPGIADFADFGDMWVDFDIVSAQIPWRFGDPDEFLAANRDFEATVEDMVYLLHFYSVTPSGRPLPREFAEIQIRDILQESRLEAYRRGLLKALREKARSEGRLRLAPINP